MNDTNINQIDLEGIPEVQSNSSNSNSNIPNVRSNNLDGTSQIVEPIYNSILPSTTRPKMPFNNKEQLRKAEKAADDQQRSLQRVVNDIANPDPVLTVSMVIIIFVIVWLIYYFFVMPNISGIWFDQAGNEWRLSKKFLSNDFTVHIDGRYYGDGRIADNYFQFGNSVGVWDYMNTIVTTDGMVLARLE